MIAAADTSVLLDILTDDRQFGETSAAALANATRAGRLVISEIVYAELAAAFRGDRDSLDGFLGDLGVTVVPSTRTVLAEAGRLWRAQRDAGGSRRRLVADFLIAAHARENADQLISRDRGFFRRWFEGLDVFDPSTG